MAQRDASCHLLIRQPPLRSLRETADRCNSVQEGLKSDDDSLSSEIQNSVLHGFAMRQSGLA